MSVTNPGFRIPREAIEGSEGLYCKMFDPPKEGPDTPEFIDLTLIGLDGNPVNPNIPAGVRANPVPSVLEAAGLYAPNRPYLADRSLMHGDKIETWDGGAITGSGATELEWFLLNDNFMKGPDIPLFPTIGVPGGVKTQGPSAPQYPAPMMRAPRGAIVQITTSCGGPPPHTIHWHGIEPTPMNDGVGHCSFEVSGSYVYQWQPNFIGTYFYHCHRNTVQHFEYGLHGLMPFSPPDAFFASIDPASVTPASRATGVVTLNSTPIGAGRDGLYRTAANLNFSGLPVFPGFIGGDPVQGVATPDPWTGNPFLKFRYDPHAFTVPFDVEVIWAPTARFSKWSIQAPSPFATFPKHGSVPGVNDGFHENAGPNGFFGFNDYVPDYHFISGIPVPGRNGTTAAIPPGIALPAVWNMGPANAQVSINMGVGQTGFIRMLNTSYTNNRITLPMDVVIIEWDGRALGVPPFGYNQPYVVPAGTRIHQSVARRYDALILATAPTPPNTFATVEFYDTRTESAEFRQFVMNNATVPPLHTTQIPIVID